MPFPDYLDLKPKIIFFTDFDGTVTYEDVPDWLVWTSTHNLGVFFFFRFSFFPPS